MLKALKSVQAENVQLRQDLERFNSQLTGLLREFREENSRIWQQMEANAAQVSELVTDVSRTVTESLQEKSEMVQKQMSDFARLAGDVENQRGFMMHQAEMMKIVMDVVQEFEDEGVNVTSRLNELEHRLSSVEGSLLQFQVPRSLNPLSVVAIAI